MMTCTGLGLQALPAPNTSPRVPLVAGVLRRPLTWVAVLWCGSVPACRPYLCAVLWCGSVPACRPYLCAVHGCWKGHFCPLIHCHLLVAHCGPVSDDCGGSSWRIDLQGKMNPTIPWQRVARGPQLFKAHILLFWSYFETFQTWRWCMFFSMNLYLNCKMKGLF